jgi:hypothetical protein
MVRKSAALRKETDMKVDGAFQDAVLKPIPGTGDFGGYQAQEEQIAAVGGPPADMLTPDDAAALEASRAAALAKPLPNIYGISDRPLESVRQDTAGDSFVELPPATNLKVTREILKRFYPDYEIQDYLEL